MAETGVMAAHAPLTVLSEEERMFQGMAADFAAHEILPHVAEMDREGVFNHALLERFFEQGFMGIEAPEAYGGSGGTFFLAILAIGGGIAVSKFLFLLLLLALVVALLGARSTG